MDIAIIVTALIPAFLLLGYGIAKTRGNWLNRALWAAVAAGVLAGVGVYPVTRQVLHLFNQAATPTLPDVAARAFFVAAVPEETAKFIGFLLVGIIFGRRQRLQDVMLLCLGIGMGFAGLENVAYLASNKDWPLVGVLRGVSAVPVHGLCGLAMGALAVQAHLRAGWEPVFYLLALLVPVLMHGAYDTTAFAGEIPEWHALATPAMVIVMGAIGLTAVSLCNAVLPRAAEADRLAETNLSYDSGMLSGWVWRLVQGYMIDLPAIYIASGFDRGTAWYCLFLGVLPLILGWDLRFNRRSHVPIPAAFDRIRSR